jgi:hypothetical protein
MKIDTATATLAVGTLAFLGTVTGTALAQWNAAKLEDRRARTEIVVEMMRSNNRDQMREKLQILTASGLLPDDNGRLQQAIGQAPVTAFKYQEVDIPILARCIKPSEIPPELPPIGKMPNDARRALLLTFARALELKAQNETMRAVLHACNDKLPSPDEILHSPAQGANPSEQRAAPAGATSQH